MSLPIFGAQAAVSILNRAFANTSPAAIAFSSQVNTANATIMGPATSLDSFAVFANAFAASFIPKTGEVAAKASALSTLILTNMGLLPNADLQEGLAGYIVQHAGLDTDTPQVGLIALQLSSIISGFEDHSVYGPAAKAWNAEVTSAASYSSNAANTTPSTPEVPVDQGPLATAATASNAAAQTAADAAAADAKAMQDAAAAEAAAKTKADATDATALKAVSDKATADAKAATDANTAAQKALADAQKAFDDAVKAGDANAVSTANGSLLIADSKAKAAAALVTSTAAAATTATAATTAAEADDAALAKATTDTATALTKALASATAATTAATKAVADAAALKAATDATLMTTDDAAGTAAVAAAKTTADGIEATVTIVNAAAEAIKTTAAASALTAYNNAATAAKTALTVATEANTAYDTAAAAATTLDQANAAIALAAKSATAAADAKTAADAQADAAVKLAAATAATTSTADDAGATAATASSTEAVAAAGKAVTDAATDTAQAAGLPAKVANPTFTLTGNDNVNEGQANTFTVTASKAVEVDTVVKFQLKIDGAGDTAQLADFPAGAFAEQSVTIEKGKTTATFSVNAITNDGTEASEKYTVQATVPGVSTATTMMKQVTIIDGSVGAGQTFMLTKGLDLIPGLTGSNGNTTNSGNDLIIGSISAITAPNAELNTLSTLDVVNGGDGTDTLRISTSDSGKTVSLPNLSKVEVIELQGTGSGGTTEIDTRALADVTHLNVTKMAEALKAKASATTNVDVSMQAAAAAVAIDGGKDVKVALTDVTAAADTITIGATAAAAGAVNVSMTGAAYTAATADTTLSAVTVTGGTTINVAQKAASSNSAAATDTNNATITQGAVAITGNGVTTAVTVKQDAAVTAAHAQSAAAAVQEAQVVTFSAMTSGKTVIVNGLTFTAKKDLTKESVAAAFANLKAGAVQGNAPATDGIYSGTFNAALLNGTGLTTGAASADKVTFTEGVASAAAFVLAFGGTATAPVAAPSVAGAPAASAVTGAMGIVAGAVTVKDSAAVGTIKTITLDSYGATSRIGGVGANDDTTSLTALNLSNVATSDLAVDATSATLALTVEKMGTSTPGAEAAITMTAAPTTLNVKSVGANFIDLTANATKTLAVSGTGLLSLADIDLTSLETVKVTETAGLTLNAGVADTVKSVDTTGTTGTVTVSIEGNRATYTGGAGSDVVSVTNASTAISKDIDLAGGDDMLDLSATLAIDPSKEIRGGAGTDTIKLSAAAAAARTGGVTFQDKITSFERLELGLVGADSTVNLDNLDDINYVITNGAGANDLILDKMLTGATIQLNAAHGKAVQFKLATNGTADTLTLITNAATGTNIGTVTADNVEAITVKVNDTVFGSGVSTNTLAIDSNAAKTIVINGEGNLVLDLSATARTKELTSVDGSTATGQLTITTLGGDTGATTVKGGTAADVLTVRGANDVAQGGAGNDTLAVAGGAASAASLTGGDGTDIFDVSGFTAANAGAAVTITDLTKGETIKFVAAPAPGKLGGDFNSTKVTLITEATFTEYVTEAAAKADQAAGLTQGGDASNGIAWFQFAGNTFIVQDVNGNAAFNDGADIIVKLTGSVDLSASSFSSDAGVLLYI